MKEYMYAQKRKIEIDKWHEGCHKRCDPGKEFIIKWIEEHGPHFRKIWQQALCKDCYFVFECGFEVRQECENYKKE